MESISWQIVLISSASILTTECTEKIQHRGHQDLLLGYCVIWLLKILKAKVK